MRTLKGFGLAIVCAAAGSAVADDLQFGGSRAAGMGGAGLALPVDVVQQGILNPALFGLGPRGFRFKIPMLGFEARGTTWGEVRDEIDRFGGGGDFDLEDISDIAIDFGDRRKEFGVRAGLGLYANGFSLDLQAQALGTTIPNAPLRAFVDSGSGNLIDLQGTGARLDGYGYGYGSLSAAYGRTVPNVRRGRLALGGRVKLVRALYTHYFADEEDIIQQQEAARGAEMGDEDVLDKTGVGLDFGLLYSPQGEHDVHFGLVVENLLEPNVGFRSTRPDGTFRGDRVNPFQRMLNVGVGYQAPKGGLLAADLVDIGNNNGRGALRVGGEMPVGRNFAIRAGYDTRTAFTIGVGFGPFNISYGARSPFTLTTALRF